MLSLRCLRGTRGVTVGRSTSRVQSLSQFYVNEGISAGRQRRGGCRQPGSRPHSQFPQFLPCDSFWERRVQDTLYVSTNPVPSPRDLNGTFDCQSVMERWCRRRRVKRDINTEQERGPKRSVYVNSKGSDRSTPLSNGSCHGLCTFVRHEY